MYGNALNFSGLKTNKAAIAIIPGINNKNSFVDPK